MREMDSNGSNATCGAPCATAYWHSKPDAYWCGFLQTCWFVIFVLTHSHTDRHNMPLTHTYANRSCKQSPLHTVHTARVSSWNQLEERNNIIRLGLWFREFCSTRKLICRCLQHQTVFSVVQTCVSCVCCVSRRDSLWLRTEDLLVHT